MPSRVDYIEGMREGSQFKPNSTYVFSIENDPNSDNVTWAVGGGQIESSQGTGRIFVKTSDTGRFFILARKRNRCGTGGATDLGLRVKYVPAGCYNTLWVMHMLYLIVL